MKQRSTMRVIGKVAGRPMLIAMSLVTASVVLTACGSGSSESSESGTLIVWDPLYTDDSPYAKAMDELDAKFEEDSKVEVKHVSQPLANYDQTLQAAFASKSGADVMAMVPGNQGVLRWTDGLTKLDDTISEDDLSRITLWDSASSSFSTDKEIYGVPIGVQGHVIYYNKSLFEKAGLDPENPPTSFEELKDAVKALKASGITPFASGNKEGYENQWWFSFLWPSFATLEESQELAMGELDFTNSKVTEVLEAYQELQDEGAFPENRFTTPLAPDGIDSFSAGKGAMFLGLVSGGANYPVWNEALGTDNVGVFEAVSGPYGAASSMPLTSTINMTVPTFAKNKSMALKYIKFVTSASSMKTLFEVGEVVPNEKASDLGSNAPPQLTSMLEAFGMSPTFQPANSVIPSATLNEYGTQMNEVLQGRLSLSEMQGSAAAAGAN